MWITLTADHVATGLTGPEISAATTAALQSGQSSPMNDVLAQVVRYVRARVKACDKNTLGPDGTIPDELLAPAIDIAVYRLAKRLPGKILAKEERVAAADKAETLLRDVAACKVALEQPEEASDETTTSSPSPRYTERNRQFGRDQLDGAF